MRQLGTWLAWLAPVVVGVPIALAHCGGGDNTVVPIDAGNKGMASSSSGGSSSSSSGSSSGGSSGSSGGTSSSGGGSGSSGGTTLPPSDGGTEASTMPSGIPVPEGGAPSDPGSIMCNGAPCDVSTGHTCCYTRTDAGSTEVCNPANTGCGGQTLACNEASDCNGGVCCQAIIGIAVQGSTSCSTGKTCGAAAGFQTCRVDSECGQNSDAGALKRCIPQECTNPTTMAKLTIEACAQPLSMFNDAGTLQYCKAL